MNAQTQADNEQLRQLIKQARDVANKAGPEWARPVLEAANNAHAAGRQYASPFRRDGRAFYTPFSVFLYAIRAGCYRHGRFLENATGTVRIMLNGKGQAALFDAVEMCADAADSLGDAYC